MMKLASPKPFTFEGGDRAVLLLHGFTGNSADVRMLGRFLEKKGYTCHAPIYKGHGVPPEQLVHTGPEDWWKEAYNQGMGKSYYGEIEYDDSARAEAISLYTPIMEPETGKAIGVMKAVCDITAIKMEL